MSHNTKTSSHVSVGKKNYLQKILDALQKRFEPSRKVIYECYIVNTTQQIQYVSTEWYAANLRKLADKCDFSTLGDEWIRDRLVLGTKNVITRACMPRDSELTIVKDIDKCRISEQAQIQNKITGVGEESVYFAHDRLWL